MDTLGREAVIKVVGVGGGGSNAVNRMIEAGLGGVDFIAVNTDAQALAQSNADIRVRIGNQMTRGLGSGGDPAVGQKAAEESREELVSVLQGADMVFVTAGMGGGTGTGASPVIAEIAREQGALTVAVVTRPFGFEGMRRSRAAQEGIVRLNERVDTLIAVQNDRLLELVDRQVPLEQAFVVADDILRQGIQGISELITLTGLINTDFADVKAVMKDGGAALMTIGRAAGEERALAAAEAAVTSPLLDINVSGAKGVLFNVKGGETLTLFEVNDAAELIRQMVDPEANIIFGAAIDDALSDEVQITVIATGFDSERAAQQKGASAQRATQVQAARTQAAQPQEQSKTIEFPLRSFDKDDLDVPSFLRRS